MYTTYHTEFLWCIRTKLLLFTYTHHSQKTILLWNYYGTLTSILARYHKQFLKWALNRIVFVCVEQCLQLDV